MNIKIKIFYNIISQIKENKNLENISKNEKKILIFQIKKILELKWYKENKR